MDKKEYIEREKIRGILHSIINDSNCHMYMLQVYDQMLDHIPAADVQEVTHGEWCGTVCSNCTASISDYYDCDYCPRCGARMDGEENDL